jgi:hypothetical protein
MQRVCRVNLGALIYGSTPCIKRLRSTVRHHLHLPLGMSATRPHGIVSVHMVQSRRRPKVTAHTCRASVGAMPAGDQLNGTWPGQMQRLSTVVSWSCRRHESSRTRGAAEAGCSGVGCSSRGRRSTRQNAASPGTPCTCRWRGRLRLRGRRGRVDANEIVNEPFGVVAEALGTLRELVEDPRIAQTVYT